MAILLKPVFSLKRVPLLFYLPRFNSSHSLKAAVNGRMTQVLQPVMKSPCDNREYRALLLSNNLKVICCSDRSTDKAAAALSVGAGSMNDPAHLPGIAHFCEHMLFLGTEKYPVENEYSKFLSDHGGSSNAYTARDHTNYYFDVSPDALEPALDRFSQFFITPLFTESATEREINAVHSEHEKNIPMDAWRSHQLELATANPDHPYSRFATGNRKTLWEDPRSKNIDVCEALREYHRNFYSSNIMSLAVLGKESLDELQAMVEKMFGDVKSFDVELPRWLESPYGPKELQKRISVVPIKDVRYLSILFPIPDFTKHYKSSAEGYVSHLLGHEGEGSLLSLLKKRNWVNALETGSHVPARGIGTYKLAVDLTPDGLKNVDEIVHHVFQYLQMLRSTGTKKWVWEEIRDVNAMIFRFKDKERPQSFVSHLTSLMHDYPLEDVLSAGYIITDFNEQLINDVLTRLVPKNCRVTVTAKDLEPQCSLTEEWYGVKYSLDDIPADLLKKWEDCEVHDDLKLPPANEFIPTKFDLKPRDENKGIVPRILMNTPFSRVWYLQDNEFQLPKAVARVEVHSPLPLVDPLNANLNFMMVESVKDALTEFSYAASVAGLHYQIMESVYGYEVQISGYDQKLGVLLEMVLNKLVQFSCKPDRFEVIKEQHIRSLRNWKDDQPYSHATYYMTTLLREKRWTNQELLEAMNDTTLEKLLTYANEFSSKLKLEWLLFGNLTEAESLDLVTKCQGLFEGAGSQPLLSAQAVRLREVELPSGSTHVFKSEHHSHLSSCVSVLFQAGMQETKTNVTVELLEHIANEPFFNQLRTKEQLGYIVFSGVRRASGTQGIQFIVQSDRHPAYLERRIDSFLNILNETLHSMTEEEFQSHRSALRVRKAEKPKKLKERSTILWSEIAGQQYNFERQDIEIAALEKLTLKDTIEYFEEKFGPNSTQRRRLAVHIISMTDGGAGVKVNEVESLKGDGDYPENQEVIEDLTEWKTHLPLYPTATPFHRIPHFLAASKSKL